MMTTLTITLPHTPRCLSPNAKAPLTQRGAIVAGYKKTAAHIRAYLPCYAWGIQDPVRLPHAVPLSAIGLTRPPQSWQYISPEQAEMLERRLA